jgi:hypothetical protein
MKKVFFIAALALVTIFGVSATVVTNTSSTESYSSSVTASIDGLGEDISFDTSTLISIYHLMPQRVKDLCVDSYADISSHIEKSGRSFTYEGVTISPIATERGTNLKFSYGSHTVVVKNYTKAEFDRIFGF